MTDEQRRQRHRTLQLRIREVAYMLWEASGRDHGRALEFWLAAEQDVLSEPVQPAETRARTLVERRASEDPDAREDPNAGEDSNAGEDPAKANRGAEDAADR